MRGSTKEDKRVRHPHQIAPDFAFNIGESRTQESLVGLGCPHVTTAIRPEDCGGNRIVVLNNGAIKRCEKAARSAKCGGEIKQFDRVMIIEVMQHCRCQDSIKAEVPFFQAFSGGRNICPEEVVGLPPESFLRHLNVPGVMIEAHVGAQTFSQKRD
jgi:hypothetical protein